MSDSEASRGSDDVHEQEALQTGKAEDAHSPGSRPGASGAAKVGGFPPGSYGFHDGVYCCHGGVVGRSEHWRIDDSAEVQARCTRIRYVPSRHSVVVSVRTMMICNVMELGAIGRG